MQKRMGHGALVTFVTRIRLFIISDFIRDTYFLKLKIKSEAKKYYGYWATSNFLWVLITRGLTEICRPCLNISLFFALFTANPKLQTNRPLATSVWIVANREFLLPVDQSTGWWRHTMQLRITKGLVLDALLMAVWRRKPYSTVMVHSDQGSQ